MRKNFNPISIPIILSIFVILAGLCLAGIVIFSVISNGFSGRYMVDGSDLTAFMRLIFMLFCVAVFMFFGTMAAVILAVIWGIYSSVRFLSRCIGNRRKKNDMDNENRDLRE